MYVVGKIFAVQNGNNELVLDFAGGVLNFYRISAGQLEFSMRTALLSINCLREGVPRQESGHGRIRTSGSEDVPNCQHEVCCRRLTVPSGAISVTVPTLGT